MADIQLTGYQGPRGFKAATAYDPSSQIQKQEDSAARKRERAAADYGKQLNRSEEQYRNQLQQIGSQFEDRGQQNLDALAKFSSTLQKDLEDRTERRNKAEYNAGLAEIMNGRAQFPESVYAEHKKEAEVLANAAEADGEVANSLEEQGNKELSLQIRKSSPAVSGWRAYGRAVGMAKKAALEVQPFLTSFMTRTDKIVPTPQGLKSPAEIAQSGDEYEIEAALAVGSEELFEARGISRINPVVLAENFAPTFQAAKSQIKSNTVSQVIANERETNEYNILSGLRVAATTENITDQELGNTYQQAVKDLQTLAGLSKGKAARLALEGMISSAESLPPEEAEAALQRLERLTKIEGDPKSGTLGKLNADQFRAARARLRQKSRQEQSYIRQQEAREVNDLIAQYKYLQNTVTDSTQLEQEQKVVLDRISQYDNAEARNFLADVAIDKTTPKEYAIYNTALTRDDMTLEMIESLNIPESLKENLRKQAADRERIEYEKIYGRQVRDSTQQVLAEAGEVSFDITGKPSQNPEAYYAYQQAVEDQLFEYREQYKNTKGVYPTQDELSKELEKISKRVFLEYYDSKGKPRKSTKEAMTIRKNADGEPVYDNSNVRIEDLDNRYDHPENSILLTENEVKANLERFRDNQQLTGRARDPRIKPAHMPMATFLKLQAEHYGINPTPYLKEAAEREGTAMRLAPGAANRLYNSDDELSQAAGAAGVAQAQQRSERIAAKEAGTFKVETPRGLITPMGDTEILQLAFNQGFNDRDAVKLLAIALAESSGDPEAHNDDASTGDDSYGLWQINMLGDMGPERRAALGLISNDQLNDPTINAMAMRYIFKQQGFNAWSVYKSGKYREFLPDAQRALVALRRGR